VSVAQNPGVGVGVSILIRRGDEILLIKRKGVHGDETWGTPGGYLEKGETLETCALREAAEETGLSVRNLKFRGLTNDVFDDDLHDLNVWFEAEYVSGEPRVNDPDEMIDVGWFAWDNLPEPLFLSMRNLVEGKCYPAME
jgi:8-oxo-dGTP diphosphatase